MAFLRPTKASKIAKSGVPKASRWDQIWVWHCNSPCIIPKTNLLSHPCSLTHALSPMLSQPRTFGRCALPSPACRAPPYLTLPTGQSRYLDPGSSPSFGDRKPNSHVCRVFVCEVVCPVPAIAAAHHNEGDEGNKEEAAQHSDACEQGRVISV